MDELDGALIEVIGSDNPETLGKAIELARLRVSDSSDKAIVECVLRFESQGKIFFEKPAATLPSSMIRHFFAGGTVWFWFVLGLSVTTTITVLAVSEDAYPVVYFRYAFGLVFVLFIPGYCLVRALFSRKDLDNIERLALSVGLSLALVPLACLLLNSTPLGIRTTPLTFSLLALTLLISLVATVRDYYVRTKSK